MEFSPPVILGLGIGALLLVAGLGAAWVGSQRRAERLPSGAHDVLNAIVDGRLEPSEGDSWVRVVDRGTTSRRYLRDQAAQEEAGTVSDDPSRRPRPSSEGASDTHRASPAPGATLGGGLRDAAGAITQIQRVGGPA